MLGFQPMTDEEFTAYKAWIIEDYARDVAENYRLPVEEALAGARMEIDAMLSQGLATSNNFLYNIVLSTEADRLRIGYLWIDVNESKKRCLIADIYLRPEYRHQGWGRKTLELLEADMKRQGIARINLHVFGNNRIAQELYTKMGYQTTGLNMQKWLTE